MKIAIYSRKSKFTGSGESTQNQIELCKEYANKHFNVKEFMVFEDEGFSGGNIDRPQYQKMMREARKGKFNILMCYRLDRISRNIADFADTIELLQENDIAFISLREQFDTSTPMGRAMMYIASVFAQLERETIAERIRDNMMQLARTGRWLGGNTPTGFESEPITYFDDNLKEKTMFRLSPIEEELLLVKELFDKYIEFQSLSQLEKYCLKNNLQTKKNGDFHKFSLRFILANPVYVIADEYIYDYFVANGVQVANTKDEFDGSSGIMVYNKNSVKKGRSVKPKDMTEWICAIGMHKGIVPGKDWIFVQETLKNNKDKAPRQGTSTLAMLSGLIRCGQCGGFIKIKYGQKRLNSNERHFYYVCSAKDLSGGSRCKCPNLHGERTDHLIIENLKRLVSGDIIKKIELNKTKLLDRSEKNKQIQSRMNTNKQAIENLVKQIVQNQNSTITKYLITEMEKIEKENNELEAKLDNADDRMELLNINLFYESVAKFIGEIDHVPYSQKRNLIKAIVDKIIWDGEKVDIKLMLT